MGLTVVGVSSHTAPVDVRERLAPAAPPEDGGVDEVLARAFQLADGEGGAPGEAMLLSTCNRVELYLVSDDEAGATERAAAFLASGGRDGEGGEARIAPDALRPHLYCHAGADAVRHLFRVASSLDSAVVGEPQILGQVKDAWERAVRGRTVGPTLGQLLPRAFSVAKRVRSETAIGKSTASVASAAVELAGRIFGALDGREVLVLGAGQTGALAARHLARAGASTIRVANRTLARAEALCEELRAGAHAVDRRGEPLRAEAHPLSSLPSLLARADVVICATGSSEPVLDRATVKEAMKARRGRWLCLLDLAVPRDINPACAELENVYLYDVDALLRVVDDHLAERRREAALAERILDEDVDRWLAAEAARRATPTIKQLRDRFLEIARAEARRTLGRMSQASEAHRREVELLAETIVNKLLHTPLTNLKANAGTLLDPTRALFELDENDAAPRARAAAF